MKPDVVITKCGDYKNEEAYRAIKGAVDLLGGIGAFVKKGERILLKPNLLSAKPSDAAVTTHPTVVRAVIQLVKEAGATPVVGDSPGIGSAEKVAQKCGIAAVAKEFDVDVIGLATSISVENPAGKTFKRLELSKEAIEADGIINLPKLKTHAQMFLTLGVKNMFGCVVGARKPQWHMAAGVDTNAFARMLVDTYLFLKPRLTIVDGIVGMQGNGPGSAGDPRRLGLLFASADCIALDRIITEALGAKAYDLPTTKVAKEDETGVTDIDEINILGEKLADVRISDFKFPPMIGAEFKLPFSLHSYLRKPLTARPEVNNKDCTLCNMCVDICPPGIMTKTDKINIDYDKCIRCFCCLEICPEGAISVKDGWLKKIVSSLQ
ncbi:MAG TPA: DUF362 domain-containing protein [Thermodesulfobacteriota bacterium]|nr:DUF362 domain-containing protein [Thermodesulfobacteriota bacterium]